jgi:ABC-2 type transport system ATP-binding protein
VLVIEGVSKKYRGAETFAVDDLTLRVRPGEIFGFLGPNGAGKTTTIKMIVGLLKLGSGRITVNGFDVTREPVLAKSQIGFVPDNPDLYDKLTGLEYLNLLADVYSVSQPDRKRRIEDCLQMFELREAVGDIIGTYSHGMKQKLALTGALLHEPPLFILDEPMVGLDPKSAHLFKDLMRKHCDRGHTVFFSTHVLEVAERICDRVGIIHKGRLISCGTVEDLRARREQADETLEDIFLSLTEESEG